MSDAPSPEINDETVEALLTDVREQLRAEDSREQSFTVRAGGLAGFVGIILALATATGRLALDADLSSLATILGASGFGIGTTALLAALGIAVIGVLVPQESAAIGLKTIERYPTWEYISKSRAMVQGEIMRGLITALAKDRQRNSSKARWLHRAYIALLVGIAALSLLGVIVAIDAA